MEEPAEKTQTDSSASQAADAAASPSEKVEVKTSQPAATEPAADTNPPAEPDTPQVIKSEPQPAAQPSGGRKKRWLKALLILIVIAALAAGGWYAYQKHQDNTKSKSASSSKDISLLKIGMLSADYGELYPNMSDNEYALIVNVQMFDGLVRYQDKSKIVPDLASDWTNPDAKTWIFTVKPNIKFHDGHTLTATDVKYSLDTVKANDSSDLAQVFASTIDSVTVTGPHTVKITTKDPDPTLLNKLTYLFIIDHNLPKGQNASMAGTGAYQLKAGTKPTSTNVQMVAAPIHNGPAPTTKALDFGSKEDSASLVKAFQAGQFNIIGPVDPNNVNKVSGSKFVSEEPDVTFLGMNTVAPGPLHNKQVREAIRYAVNSSAIAKANGSEGSQTAQLVPDSIPGFNPAIKPYKQDLAKAKQLLTQAGYPNGFPLKLSSASDPNEVNEVATELRAIGINVTVDQHADFDEFINFFTGGQAQMFLVDYGSDTLDGLDVYQSTIIPDYYANTQFSSLLDQASTENDPAKRLKLLQQAGSVVDQDIPVVPLYGANDLWIMDKNYAIHQDMPAAYISVYFSGVQLK